MNRERQALGALALTTVAWATTFVVVRDLVSAEKNDALPPMSLVAIRFGLAAVAALAASAAFRQKILSSTWRRGTLLGILTAGGFGFQTVGMRYTTAARSAFITNVSLLLVPVFGVLLGRAWPGRGWWLGAAMALGGLWILEFPWDAIANTHDDKQRSSFMQGDLLTLGCATFFALQILTTEIVSPKEPLLPLVFVQFASCGACAVGVAWLVGEFDLPAARFEVKPVEVAQIVYLALVATAVCLLVQAWAQRHTSSVRAAVVFMLEPVLASILGFVVLKEHFTPGQWIGAGVVIVGILVAELLSSVKPAPNHA